MEKIKMTQLNILFEKMVSDAADNSEKRALNRLYQEYINEGRKNILNHSPNQHSMHIVR